MVEKQIKRCYHLRIVTFEIETSLAENQYSGYLSAKKLFNNSVITKIRVNILVHLTECMFFLLISIKSIFEHIQNSQKYSSSVNLKNCKRI